MKYNCNFILITLAFVHVPSVMTTRYARSVFITNEHIKRAFVTKGAELETAIENIILGDATIEKIDLMLAIPESAFIFHLPKLIEKAEKEAAKSVISHFTYLPVPILDRDEESIAIAHQEALQSVLLHFTNISVPELDPKKVIRNDTLLMLGRDRRIIIGEVTKTLLLSTISREAPKFLNLTVICRLIGLVRSIKFPVNFIRTAIVDSDGIFCILTSFDDTIYKYKRFRGTVVMERQIDSIRMGLEPLKEQIKTWYQ
ncbi:uncharacterized protein LOC126836638 isoform X1 [Adelges cooleyi]|uniref:uncharacterized protein LOC126836638 isoform X1 n=1 Tax=Adelges cooleyi TaxID=133065 RepID=UPI00217F5203|nr:uncharacterized protein LOC126836638 isoform X1 [Adelges cooleyi]